MILPVAAQVLKRTPHVLEVEGQRFVLTVRAADPAQVGPLLVALARPPPDSPCCLCSPQVDFLVEATLQLNTLLDRTEVGDVLRSLGFVWKNLTPDQVRVKGSFLKLKAVKASLEMLLKSPARGDVSPVAPVPKASSGTISKHSSTMSSSVGDSPGTLDHPGTASCAVEPDVYEYAKRLRKKDVDAILVGHDVTVKSVKDSYIITVLGTRADVCMNRLKTLLDNLHRSLRTQEVPLKDLTPEGRHLAARIQESRNIYKSVLVQRRSRNLHLVGPSVESYLLKQMLLGRTVDQTPRRGRGTERTPTRRSSSLPPSRTPAPGPGPWI